MHVCSARTRLSLTQPQIAHERSQFALVYTSTITYLFHLVNKKFTIIKKNSYIGNRKKAQHMSKV